MICFYFLKKIHLVQLKKKCFFFFFCFFVILCVCFFVVFFVFFFLKSCMASFLEYILDSIYAFKVVDFIFWGFAQAGLVFVA